MMLTYQNTTLNDGAYATHVTFVSFLIGTFLFLCGLVTENEGVFLLGFWYTVLAFLVNSVILLHLIYLLVISPSIRKSILVRILLLLSNIPIAILYIYILFNTI